MDWHEKNWRCFKKYVNPKIHITCDTQSQVLPAHIQIIFLKSSSLSPYLGSQHFKGDREVYYYHSWHWLNVVLHPLSTLLALLHITYTTYLFYLVNLCHISIIYTYVNNCWLVRATCVVYGHFWKWGSSRVHTHWSFLLHVFTAFAEFSDE